MPFTVMPDETLSDPKGVSFTASFRLHDGMLLENMSSSDVMLMAEYYRAHTQDIVENCRLEAVQTWKDTCDAARSLLSVLPPAYLACRMLGMDVVEWCAGTLEDFHTQHPFDVELVLGEIMANFKQDRWKGHDKLAKL